MAPLELRSNPVIEGMLEDARGDASRPLSGLVFFGALYLVLPVAMFLLTWVHPLLGLPALSLLVWGLVRLWKECPCLRLRVDRATAVMGGIALAWALMGGAGHIFYANRYDWLLRDAVLRDLVAGSWPIGYQAEGGAMVLRCPLAYYLPAAAIGKLTSARLADLFLFAWSALGVWLLLLMATDEIQETWKKVAFCVVIIFFSGMDLLGWLLWYGDVPSLGRHMEWWARLYQYPSHTTQLFWVPNHCIPGWIATVVVWRYRHRRSLLSFLPYLGMPLILWAPFSLVGWMPFAVASLVSWMRTRRVVWSNWKHLLLTAPAGLLSFVYVMAAAKSVPGGPSIRLPWSNLQVLVVYFFFTVCEWFLLWALLSQSGRFRWYGLVGAVLLLLPLVGFGPSNDLTMRACIPALMILALAVAERLLVDPGVKVSSRIAIAVVVCVGAVTPCQEMVRSLGKARWDPDPERTLQDLGNGKLPGHYATPYHDSGLERYLRRPSLIPPGPSRPRHHLGVAEDECLASK